MNPKKLSVSNNTAILKARFQNFPNSKDRNVFEMHYLCIFWHFAFQFLNKIVSLDAMQNCVYLYLAQLLLQFFLACVAALFLASASKLSRTRGADARTGDLKSRRIDSVSAKISYFQGLFQLFVSII